MEIIFNLIFWFDYNLIHTLKILNNFKYDIKIGSIIGK